LRQNPYKPLLKTFFFDISQPPQIPTKTRLAKTLLSPTSRILPPLKSLLKSKSSSTINVVYDSGTQWVPSTRQNPDSAKSRFSTDFSDLEKISRYQGYSLLEASQSRRTPHRLKPLRWGFRNRRVCCNPMSRTQLSNNFSGFCTLNNVQL